MRQELSKMHLEKCYKCDGTGKLRFNITYKKEICPECRGTGQVIVSASSKYPKGHPSELIPIGTSVK